MTRKEINKMINGKVENLGYLIWQRIPWVLLHETDLSDMLDSNEEDPNWPADTRSLVREFKISIQGMIEELKLRRVDSIRTGISWAEWDTPGGRSIIDWYIRRFAGAGLKILPDLTFTPPRLGIAERVNSPPRNLISYAHFVDEICRALGNFFEEIELWNEWNLITDWDPSLDQDYSRFEEMIALGALIGKAHGKKVILGGMAGVRDQSLMIFRGFIRHGLLNFLDVVGFHALRGTWSDLVPPPPLDTQAMKLQHAMAMPVDNRHFQRLCGNVRLHAEESALKDILLQEMERLNGTQAGQKKVWITEYGFPPFDPANKFDKGYLEDIQVSLYADALNLLNRGKLDRVYWYTLRDKIAPSLRLMTTGWEDVLQYYYGDCEENGRDKLLARLLKENGPTGVLQYVHERDLWHLVEEASLSREMPSGYISQDPST